MGCETWDLWLKHVIECHDSPQSTAYNIPNPSMAIHDVELHNANDEDVDPFMM